MMQDAIKTIIEMDDALTNLNKVVDLSKSQLDDMRASAIELGKSMGISATEILRGMAEFGRISKITDDIKELTRVATLASNVTTLTADDAAKAIVSTMITFKKEVKDASHIIDSFNEVQNNFRVSAEDLADSISKVGAAARQAGISMEELEGYTAAIVSSTGITGSVAGTALKSIISRTYRIGTEGETSAGEVEETLAGIGVAVRDTSKEFRSFDTIMADLAKK
jgi:TP901 family phage tail tape measure protein